ncbi:MAG TPA: hypothetical protein PKZ56_02700 [Candidatus Paceibacterota bacterium]|nr:hypothetical protein [Candidatus Paceibacterota bacterium]
MTYNLLCDKFDVGNIPKIKLKFNTVKEKFKKDSPLYASITFNNDTTEATVVLGTNEPRVIKSKLGIAVYLGTYIETDLIKALTKEEFQKLTEEDFEMIKAVCDTLNDSSHRMPMSNEEDEKLLESSPLLSKMPRVKITVIMRQESKIDWPMKEPKFEACSNCKKSGKFVDVKNPNSKSRRFFAKQDALEWLQVCVQKKQYKKEEAELLAKQVHDSGLAGTYAEYLANLQKAEQCAEN